MDDLMKLVNSVINTEYYSAALKHGRLNHSDHESYAIIDEEFEESTDEMTLVSQSLNQFWKNIRNDADDAHKLNDLRCLEYHAMLAACEFIQVAAMARKAMLTIHERSRAE